MSYLDVLLLGIAFFTTVDSIEIRAALRRAQAQLAELLSDNPPNVHCLTDELYYGPVRVIPGIYDQDREAAR